MNNITKIKYLIRNFFTEYKALLIGTLVSGIFLIILGFYAQNRFETYKDLIVGNPAIMGTNESGETFSFWISLFLGLITMFFYTIKKQKKVFHYKEDEQQNIDFIGVGIFLIPMLLSLIIKQEVNIFYLIVGILYFSLSFFIKKTNEKKEMLLLIFSIYIFSLTIKAVLDKLFKGTIIISQDMIYPVSIIIVGITMYYLKKKNFKNIRILIMKFQIFTPLLLLTSLTNRYIVNGDRYKIRYPQNYVLLIYSLIIILIVFNFFQYMKRKNEKHSSSIFLSTVILMFIIHHYVTPLFFSSGDLWHRGEEMITWHQLIDKKLMLYKNYSGTSGLYALVLGFFQNIILQGKSFDYLPALSLTNIFWCVLFGALVYLVTNEKLALLISLITFLPEYNRVYMIAICLLVLSNAKIVKNRIYWLQLYLLLSILSVFHYPLNGIAATLGGAPFAFIQLYLVLKEKDFTTIWKKKTFWFLNLLLIYPVIWTLKYALKLVQAMSLLSSQSLLADGITLWTNQYTVPPQWFMKYILNHDLRIMLWTIFVFLLAISFLFTFLYYLYLYLYNGKFKISSLKERGFFLLSFACIALPINYTYTTMRVDYTEGTSRLTGIFIVFTVFNMLIFLFQYGDKILGRNLKIITFSFFITLILLMQVREVPLRESRNLMEFQQTGEEVKILKNEYELPDDLVLVDEKEEGLHKLGKGFIRESDMQYLKTYKEMADKLLKPNEVFWPTMNRELLFIFDNKVPAKIDSPHLTKTLKVSKNNLESIEQKPIFLTEVRGYDSYYTFKWIIDNGYVMYKYKGIDFWIRPDRYQEIFGNINVGKKHMVDNHPSQDIQKIAFSFGNSMHTLNNLFINKKEFNLNNITITGNQVQVLSNSKIKIMYKTDPYIILKFPEKIKGTDFDFIYLELKSNYSDKKQRRVQLFWDGDGIPFNENRTMWLDDVNGKMLIPIGSHPGWLFSTISRLRIDFEKVKVGTEIEVKSIKFLKLNVDRKE